MTIKVVHLLGDPTDVIVRVDEQCLHPDTITEVVTYWDGYDYQVTSCAKCEEVLYHDR